MHYTIYKITNNINGKVYIGKHQTSDLNDGYFGSGKRLKYAVNKHGMENFTKEILHVFDNEIDMNAKEAELVTEEFCKRSDTYNLCPGGNGGFGYINGDEDIKKKRLKNLKEYNDSEIQRNYGKIFGSRLAKLLQNEEYRLNFLKKIKLGIEKSNFVHGSQWLGRTHTEETKRLISEKASLRIGEKNSAFGSKWITNGIENRKIKEVDIVPEGWYYGRKMKV